MKDFLAYLPLLNVVLFPVLYWVIKVEKKLTRIELILGLCPNCPKPK